MQAMIRTAPSRRSHRSASIEKNLDFIKALTTPYGSTTFTYGDLTTNSNLGDSRFTTTVDPLGCTNCVEFEQGVDAEDSSGVVLINPNPLPVGMNTCDAYPSTCDPYLFDASRVHRIVQQHLLKRART